MLDCQACISRYIRIIFANVFRTSHHLGLPPPSAARRAYHSSRPIHHGNLDFSKTAKPQIQRYPATRHQTTQTISRTPHFSAPPPSSSEYRRDRRAADRGVIHSAGLNTPARPDHAVDFKKKKELDREILYLQDPLKLAENTIALLRKDDNEKALDLVRAASKQIPCTVSWNHVVDYEMSKGRIQKAVKIYNEMKKRAQKPDAQTFTIILRGLSWHPHLQETVPLALKIYHSMFAENCPIKPNIIHTNAVLNVCARARDMDALWGVAARLPPKGQGAPNNLTFTMILNAIRVSAFSNDKDLGDEAWEEQSLRRQRAVMRGRQIWEEIVPRWRAGDMWIDEELMCAMGRLLLLGSVARDYDDILSLAEQVMSIPRRKRPLQEPREVADAGEQTASAQKSSDDKDSVIREGRQNDPMQEKMDGDDLGLPPSPQTPILNPALANVFQLVSTAPKISFARPGRNTLSLLLDACINLRAIPSAQAYWGLLTDPSGPYNVIPDSENYHSYLRVLRVQRNSKAAAGLIADMYSGELKGMGMLQPKTFRIALSACVRDRNSPHAMEHTIKILNVMYKALPEPDIKSLEMFLDVAAAPVKRDFRITLEALRALETGTRLLRNYVLFGAEGAIVTDELKGAATEFAKRLVGVYDSVLFFAGDRLEGGERSGIMKQKAGLSAWVQRRMRGVKEGGRREAREPVKEGEENLVRKIRESEPLALRTYSGDRHGRMGLKGAAGHTRMLRKGARRGEGVGVWKRMKRARVARERSGEFEGFE